MRIFKSALLLLLCALALVARADLQFPELSGRVVDSAQMIDAPVREALNQQLLAHEKATGEQIVVVTVANLQGTTIEDYGYQLGRHWGIGQKGKNTGALLIVARDERKVRIEVGYGLEDRLTDAQSSLIINQLIVPQFKRDHVSSGISSGVDAMLKVLGSPLAEKTEPEGDFGSRHPVLIGFLMVLFVLICAIMQLMGFGPRGGGSGGFGSSGGGRSGGGFSGGGGSFGGGGSSGSW
ncbi:TPM domain-containing protein [Pseudomonas sp. MWU13-2105]|uniref:TPM domain-containing protein n=1 Tax=Pseudomonas sp. MWU13-2105 TaxID=2935074 RepID=UPI00200F7005|nr:TPM domain-containing protein [Pseudomonas sp. MWU13-2105]